VTSDSILTAGMAPRLAFRATLLLALLFIPVGARAQSAAAGPSLASPLPGVGFGGSVLVMGEEIVAGDGSGFLREGRVYVFGPSSEGRWTERMVLTAPDPRPSDGFGSSLFDDGGILLVSAPQQEGGRGAVYRFRQDSAGRWQLLDRILGPDTGPSDTFGYAMATEDGWLFIGAPGASEGRGRVYLFRREGGGWIAAGSLTGEGRQPRDGFGSALAASAGFLLVGVPGHAGRTGAVEVYHLDTTLGEWGFLEALPATGTGRSSAFGTRLVAGPRRVVASAPGFGLYGPAAYVFDLAPSGDRWIQRSRLVAFDGMPQDGFGSALALDGESIWVGSPQSEGTRGAAYLFRAEGDRWLGSTRIEAAGFQVRDRFGGSVAARDGLIAIGAMGVDQATGAISVLSEIATGEWREEATLVSEPEALATLVGAPLQCTGGRVAFFACAGVELLSFLSVPDLGGGRGIRLNDVWGWQDLERGRDIAIVGRTDGVSFVDVTDPTRPVVLGEMLRTAGSPVATWRDMKVYRDHVYVVADASQRHGMQVFDLRRLRAWDGSFTTWEPDLTYDGIASAHNIVINEETGFAYAVGANGGGYSCGGGLHMIDIREPLRPTFAGCFSDALTGRASTGYTHDAQCVVYRGPDPRHQDREICFGANETSLSIADVTDKENPVALSRAGYPNVGYSHQGWLTEDQHYFYMNDELDEIQGLTEFTRTIIWDVSVLDDPQVAGEYFSPVRASDHNLYIVGQRMYQSNYTSGLRIIDIADPLQPVEIGYLDTAPFDAPTPGFEGSWSNYPFFPDGKIVVTSIREGLFLVRPTPPAPVF